MFLVPVPRRNHELARLIDDSFDRFFSAGRDTPESISPALDIVESQDAWTVTVNSGACSCHVEHTIAVTSSGARVLTRLAEGPR
jgi:methionine aminopeptidase